MQNSGSRIRGRLLGALGVSALALMSGCSWFERSTPADMAKVRPGAEQNVPVSSSLPPPPSDQRYDPPIAPVDDTRNTPKIGSIVPESGGQKAQLEKQEKEDEARDTQEREAREKADRAAKEADQNAPGKQATTEPPTQPVGPQRAPVTSTPVPPPSAEPAPSGPAAQPTPPASAKPSGY